MAIYINLDAVKDSSISKSKLDTALANELNGKQEALTLTVKAQWEEEHKVEEPNFEEQ